MSGRYKRIMQRNKHGRRAGTQPEVTLVKLLVNLLYDAEYKGYVAEVPELPGCMSQGKTVERAMANVREAISL